MEGVGRTELRRQWRPSKVKRAKETELDPNNIQRTLLKHAGTTRSTYNWGLAGQQKQYNQTGTSSNAITLHRELNPLKGTDFPWMYEVSKCAPQEALRDLEDAFTRFFKEQTRYPNSNQRKTDQLLHNNWSARGDDRL